MPARKFEAIELWCDRCGDDKTIMMQECSWGRMLEMAREEGWYVDRITNEAYCPVCKERHDG